MEQKSFVKSIGGYTLFGTITIENKKSISYFMSFDVCVCISKSIRSDTRIIQKILYQMKSWGFQCFITLLGAVNVLIYYKVNTRRLIFIMIMIYLWFTLKWPGCPLNTCTECFQLVIQMNTRGIIMIVENSFSKYFNGFIGNKPQI